MTWRRAGWSGGERRETGVELEEPTAGQTGHEPDGHGSARPGRACPGSEALSGSHHLSEGARALSCSPRRWEGCLPKFDFSESSLHTTL